MPERITRLKQRRTECGISLEEMAKAIDLNRDWYFDIEEATELSNEVDLLHAFRICEKLAVVPTWLFELPSHDAPLLSAGELSNRLQKERQNRRMDHEQFAGLLGWNLLQNENVYDSLLASPLDALIAVSKLLEIPLDSALMGLYQEWQSRR